MPQFTPAARKTLTAADRALRILTEKGMARLHEFKAAGIAEAVVARLTRSGRVVRLARGQSCGVESDGRACDFEVLLACRSTVETPLHFD